MASVNEGEGFEELEYELRKAGVTDPAEMARVRRSLEDVLKATRTFSGYERRLRVRGPKTKDDKEFEKRLAKHKDEIDKFYRENPGLGRDKE